MSKLRSLALCREIVVNIYDSLLHIVQIVTYIDIDKSMKPALPRFHLLLIDSIVFIRKCKTQEELVS